MKPTVAQISAIRSAIMWAERGVYMPYANQARSFEVCERRGWMIYRRVDDGYPRNGYEVTPAGKEIINHRG